MLFILELFFLGQSKRQSWGFWICLKKNMNKLQRILKWISLKFSQKCFLTPPRDHRSKNNPGTKIPCDPSLIAHPWCSRSQFSIFFHIIYLTLIISLIPVLANVGYWIWLGLIGEWRQIRSHFGWAAPTHPIKMSNWTSPRPVTVIKSQ